MGTYIPGTTREQEEMLRRSGYDSFEDMFSCIPDEVRQKKPLDIPPGKSEMEAEKILRRLAGSAG